MNRSNRILMLTISAIALLGVTGCSSGGGPGLKNQGNSAQTNTDNSSNNHLGIGGGSNAAASGNTSSSLGTTTTNGLVQVSVQKGFQPSAVQMVNATQAYIAAGNKLYETMNQGSNWVQKWQGHAQLLKLDFENSTDGFAIAATSAAGSGLSNLQLLHTTNGGAGWTQIADQSQLGVTAVPANARFSLSFHNRDQGIITISPLSGSSQPISVLVTDNGGTTWTKAYLPPRTAAVAFADTTTGFALADTGQNYAIEKTTDGGRQWNIQMALPIRRVQTARIQTYGSSGVWVTAVQDQAMNQASFLLYRSTDSGSHWKLLVNQHHAADPALAGNSPQHPLSTTGPGTIPVMLDPVAEQNAFLLGSSPARGLGQSQIAKITANKVDILSHFFPGPQGWVLFLNNLQGWVVTTAQGQPTNVYVTTDGGTSWKLKTQFLPRS